MESFPPLHRLCRHFYQARLGLAVRKRAQGSDSFVGVLLRQSSSLLDPIAVENQLPGLSGGG
jgi:hypothetical protein